MLKIKFWRIENVVLIKILEQGDEIKRGERTFFTSTKTGVKLSSIQTPEIDDDKIYVRGNVMSRDNSIAIKKFNTTAESKIALNNYVQTIAEYNRSQTETANPESDDDIETIIAE